MPTDQRTRNEHLYTMAMIQRLASQLDPAVIEELLADEHGEYQPFEFYVQGMRDALGYVKAAHENVRVNGNKRDAGAIQEAAAVAAAITKGQTGKVDA